MSKKEDPDLNLTPALDIDTPDTGKIRARISSLETGVQEASRTQQETEDLGGPDSGIYGVLAQVAVAVGYRMVDNDEVTKEILRDGRKGLNKKFVSGWVLMVKQGSPLQMSATLAHELAHSFTPPIVDKQGQVLSETVAEGTAFVVCDHFGLDISRQAFPHIAVYNKGIFTPETKERIETISTWMISQVQRAMDRRSKN